MKPLILLVFFAAQIQAQPIQFPLNIGDRWQYDYVTIPLPTLPAYTIRVVRDTVMPGGISYAVLQDETWKTNDYVRQFGDSVFRYSPVLKSEILWFDFSRRIGDTVSSTPTGNDTMDIVLRGTGINESYGRTLRTWLFGVNPGRHMVDDDYIVSVVDSIGVIRKHPSFGDDAFLEGASISGRIYGTIAGLSHIGDGHPRGFALYQNFPNPFNPSTNIRYALPASAHVTLTVVNTLGQIVATLVDETQEGGNHVVHFDGSRIASGVYLYRLKAGEYSVTKRLVILR